MITAALTPELDALTETAFGSMDDPIAVVDLRAETLLKGYDVIVWEGDASTFAFGYVSDSAERLLGYPAHRWTTEPTFWADVVLHPEDRNEAIAYCALATGQSRDHDFVYRARTADGRLVRLHDIVRVVVGAKGLPVRLRGIMIRVPDDDTPERLAA